MEKKEISGKVRVNNASFNGIVNASSVDFKSSIVNNDNINACVAERGVAGFSPVANVTTNGDDVTITITDYIGTTTATIPDMTDEVERIEALIPNTASLTNKLVDSATLNSSIQTATSNFRGDWATYADIPADASLYPVDATGVRTPSTNDYLVVVADEEQNGGTWRYKYVGLWSVDGKNGWQAEYQVNETPFTVDQLAAINSGITSELVEEIGQGGGGLEIGDIGIAPLGIDETQGKRRYLNGQVVIQEQYVEFTNKVKSAIALYPTLSCTEQEWQTTATMTVGGQVGKFVVDNDAGTIRLPKIIMPIQGLTNLANLAEIVEAGLPNITGSFDGYQVGRANSGYKGTGAITARTGTYAGTGDEVNKSIGFDFNASLSSSTYGNSDTVQQEQIQYPYFIQVATGAETEDNIINEIELNNPYTLFDSKYSPNALYNASWLKSEGQYNSGAVYVTCYEGLLVEYNTNIEVGTTTTLPSGTDYTKKGLSVKLSTEEYTDYDFVLNTAEETFRLPLTTKDDFVVESYTDETEWYRVYKSGWVEQGGIVNIPNQGGTIKTLYKSMKDNKYSTLLTGETYSGGTMTNDCFWVNGQTTTTIDIDMSSASNANYCSWYVYGQGADIPTTKTYFYVGETVQNANLINAGRIEEIKANKTDVDGQWVSVYNHIYNNSALASGSNVIIDLSSILPNDGHMYECLFRLRSSRGDSSGTNNYFVLTKTTDTEPTSAQSTQIWGCVETDGANFQQAQGFAIMPIGMERNVRLSNLTYESGCYLWFIAYRRIGTNI